MTMSESTRASSVGDNGSTRRAITAAAVQWVIEMQLAAAEQRSLRLVTSTVVGAVIYLSPPERATVFR